MKTVYKANDNTIFDTRFDCLQYEANITKADQINEMWNGPHYDAMTVGEFIMSNIDKLNKIINTYPQHEDEDDSEDTVATDESFDQKYFGGWFDAPEELMCK